MRVITDFLEVDELLFIEMLKMMDQGCTGKQWLVL